MSKYQKDSIESDESPMTRETVLALCDNLLDLIALKRQGLKRIMANNDPLSQKYLNAKAKWDLANTLTDLLT